MKVPYLRRVHRFWSARHGSIRRIQTEWVIWSLWGLKRTDQKKLAQTKRDKHWALLSKNLCYNLCSGFPKTEYKFLCILKKDKKQKQAQPTRNRSHVEVRKDVRRWKPIELYRKSSIKQPRELIYFKHVWDWLDREGSLFNLAKMMVSVLNKELESKVEQLRHMELMVTCSRRSKTNPHFRLKLTSGSSKVKSKNFWTNSCSAVQTGSSSNNKTSKTWWEAQKKH